MQPVPIEQAVIVHLRAVTGKPASTKVPATRPTEFFRVTRTGGDRINLVESRPTVLVESWADADTNAWANVSAAWAALERTPTTDLPLSVCVMEARLTEPVNYPDSATGSPRYQFIYQPTVILEGIPT